eukprot:373272_1
MKMTDPCAGFQYIATSYINFMFRKRSYFNISSKALLKHPNICGTRSDHHISSKRAYTIHHICRYRQTKKSSIHAPFKYVVEQIQNLLLIHFFGPGTVGCRTNEQQSNRDIKMYNLTHSVCELHQFPCL